MPEMHFPAEIMHRTMTRPGTMTAPHWHEHLQFFRFKSGSASVTCGSRTMNVVPGDIVIVNSREIHEVECLDAPMEVDVIRVDFEFVSSPVPDAGQLRYVTPLERGEIIFANLVRGDPAVARLLDDLIDEYDRRDECFELAFKGILLILLATLYRAHRERCLGPRERARRERTVDRLSAALAHIDANLGSELRLEDLAHLAGVGTFHFCRLFRAATGKTPIEYVNAARIARAETMLLETDKSVTDIAFECGFSDANYFSRLFKRCRGYSPKTARGTSLPR